MTDINTVLCPIDFSAESTHAFEHASAIARWYEARLVGLHAFSYVFASAHDTVVAGHAPALSNIRSLAEARADLDNVLTGARKHGIVTEALVPEGSAADTILRMAAALPANLIVMGTHGLTGFEHLLLGSVTEKVLRKARCPVLTVPPRAAMTSKLPYKRMVCAVDFSESSLAALKFGLSIAQECDAEVTILHVFESGDDTEPLTDRPMTVPEYWRYRENDAAGRLAALAPDGTNNWCTARTRMERGKPYREILKVAAETATDLIVMGVQGRNALDLMLFGSTTNQVVRRATCPVLTLRT